MESATNALLGNLINLGSFTLIMAFEVIRNNVALSVTCLIFSPMSPPTRNPSSSDKDLCA